MVYYVWFYFFSTVFGVLMKGVGFNSSKCLWVATRMNTLAQYLPSVKTFYRKRLYFSSSEHCLPYLSHFVRILTIPATLNLSRQVHKLSESLFWHLEIRDNNQMYIQRVKTIDNLCIQFISHTALHTVITMVHRCVALNHREYFRIFELDVITQVYFPIIDVSYYHSL